MKILNFLNKEYHISKQITSVSREKNKKIKIKASTIAKMLFMGMFCREKSINQIIKKVHKRKKYKNLFYKKEIIQKMHGFREGIKDINLEDLKQINKNIIRKAKENKMYWEGTIDRLVVVGIDGSENFGSYKKDWNNSFKCKVKNQKYINGKKEVIEEEYHKQINVFARIVGKRPGIILGYEKITCNGNEGKQEYDPNVGIKLIEKLKKQYGTGIDVIVGDTIYLNEKVIKALKKEKYIGVFRLKENNRKIYEDAKGLFKIKKSNEFKYKGQKIKYWTDIFEYRKNKVKVIKYIEQEEKEIYVVSTDTNLNEKTINKIIHARWDIENEGFNELKKGWNMKHCYMADEKGIDVILQMIIMSYNLWEIYLYGHLHDFENSGITKFGYIDEIREKLYVAKIDILYFSSA